MWTTQIQSSPHFVLISSSPMRSPLASARRTPAEQAAKAGVLGLAVLTAYKSKPQAHPVIPISRSPHSQPNQIQRQEEEDEEGLDRGQLSGSDVLLALQQVATRRRMRKKNNSSSSGRGSKSKSQKGGTWLGGGSDDDLEENDQVPSSLMIKSEWCKKIQDLERRLQELSEI